MPFDKKTDVSWSGWLFDNLGGREKDLEIALREVIERRKIPNCKIKTGTVDMWWRSKSLYVDVTQTLDGPVEVTIHIQEYGTSIWVAIVSEDSKQTKASGSHNYYKFMARTLFLDMLGMCVEEAAFALDGQVAVTSHHLL